jgi:hypothetical protein
MPAGPAVLLPESGLCVQDLRRAGARADTRYGRRSPGLTEAMGRARLRWAAGPARGLRAG